MPLLEVTDLRTGYGTVPILHGISLTVEEGEIVAILGPNGAGKTTTLSAISGLIKPWSGSITYAGNEIGGANPGDIVAQGVAHVPEGRRVFPALTVVENLKLGSWVQRGKTAQVSAALERVFSYFPILDERRDQYAGTLSGGEQQMLAIGRALMASPKMLIIDEAALGLAPVMVERVFEIVKEIRRDGNTVLLVEQNAPVTLALADRVYLMQRGEIVAGGPASEIRGAGVLDAYLGPMAAAARALAGDDEAPLPAPALEYDEPGGGDVPADPEPGVAATNGSAKRAPAKRAAAAKPTKASVRPKPGASASPKKPRAASGSSRAAASAKRPTPKATRPSGASTPRAGQRAKPRKQQPKR